MKICYCSVVYFQAVNGGCPSHSLQLCLSHGLTPGSLARTNTVSEQFPSKRSSDRSMKSPITIKGVLVITFFAHPTSTSTALAPSFPVVNIGNSAVCLQWLASYPFAPPPGQRRPVATRPFQSSQVDAFSLKTNPEKSCSIRADVELSWIWGIFSISNFIHFKYIPLLSTHLQALPILVEFINPSLPPSSRCWSELVSAVGSQRIERSRFDPPSLPVLPGWPDSGQPILIWQWIFQRFMSKRIWIWYTMI